MKYSNWNLSFGMIVVLFCFSIESFSQCVSGDCENGKGKYIFKGGKIYYDGEWKNGKKHGLGTLQTEDYKYTGEWEDDKQNGKGTLNSDNFDYIGEWRNGLHDGKGTYSTKEFTYTGKFKENKYNGKGYINYKTGGTEEGEWENDIKNGDFSIIFPDKNKLECKYRNDEIIGKAKVYYANGDYYEGILNNDFNPNGEGVLIFKSGGKQIGKWKDGNFIDGSENETVTIQNSNIVKFKSIKYGVFTVPVDINGLNLDFIFDTGATETMITEDLLTVMIRNNKITEDDILEGSSFKTADGNINDAVRFKIRNLTIGNLNLKNVNASIINLDTYKSLGSILNKPLLLGQNVIRQLGKFEIDYYNETITIKK